MRKKERKQRILAEMWNVRTREWKMEKRTDPAQIRKSLRTKAFLSVKFFLLFLSNFFFFWSSVFGIWRFWFFHLCQVCVSLLSSFFPSLLGSVGRDPSELVKQVFPFPFFFASHSSHSFFLLLIPASSSAGSLTLQPKS